MTLLKNAGAWGSLNLLGRFETAEWENPELVDSVK
jgi:hypothetical protein